MATMNISFIGPRLIDIGGYEECQQHIDIQMLIKSTIDGHKVAGDKVTVLTALGPGIERWSAQFASELQIPYNVYIPFKDCHKKWPGFVQKEYLEFLKNSNKKIILDKDITFTVAKMIAKDQQIIEDSDKIYHFFPIEIGNRLITKARELKKEVVNLIVKTNENEEWITL